jgi:hypothetical protein
MRPFITDPTAGRRAAEINLFPTVVLPIFDPTDPRCGAERLGPVRRFHVRRRIADPTDPRVAGR